MDLLQSYCFPLIEEFIHEDRKQQGRSKEPIASSNNKQLHNKILLPINNIRMLIEKRFGALEK